MNPAEQQSRRQQAIVPLSYCREPCPHCPGAEAWLHTQSNTPPSLRAQRPGVPPSQEHPGQAGPCHQACKKMIPGEGIPGQVAPTSVELGPPSRLQAHTSRPGSEPRLAAGQAPGGVGLSNPIQIEERFCVPGQGLNLTSVAYSTKQWRLHPSLC